MDLYLGNLSANHSLLSHTSTPDYVAPRALYSSLLTIWFWLMIILSLFGSFTNILLAITILSSKKLRFGCGSLIAHLLFINASLCLVHMPILSVATYYFAPYRELDGEFCRYTIMFYYSALYAVDWSSLFIAVHQFVAILLPHAYYRLTSRVALVPMALTGWVIAYICNLFLFFGFGGSYRSTKPWGSCGIRPLPSSRVYPIVTAVCVTIPFCLEGAIYSVIFISDRVRTFRRHNQVHNQLTVDTAGAQRFMRRYKIAKMLFVAYVWYCVCFLPAPIASSLFPKMYSTDPVCQIFTRALLLCGYATTPVIYWIMNKEYRRQFWIAMNALTRKARLASFILLDRSPNGTTAVSTYADTGFNSGTH